MSENNVGGVRVERVVRQPDLFFSYDPNDGFDTHETADQAMAAAEKALDRYRNEAPDGWDEDVTGVCWGEIKQITVETERRPRTDDDICEPCLLEIIDYGLMDAD
jgi:hypothetical protein